MYECIGVYNHLKLFTVYAVLMWHELSAILRRSEYAECAQLKNKKLV